MTLEATQPRERVATLDVLRGFALCGVLIGNLFWLYSARMLADTPDTGVLDQAARWFVMIFVESKAQTLLTFLFGFGFAAQLLRAQRRAEPVMGVYLRRLIVLFVIGALHVTLLWWGDVTWTYAVAGFGLLVFLRASTTVRLVAAAILTIVPFVLIQATPIGRHAAELLITPATATAVNHRLASAIAGTSYLATIPAQVQFALVWSVFIYGWYFLWLVGRFVIGHVAGTQRWFERDGADHLRLFRWMLAIGLPIAVVASVLEILRHQGVIDPHRAGLAAKILVMVVYQLGLVAFTAAYVAIVVLLMQRPRWRRVLKIVAPVGRMPLTTYLMQSAICTFIFYGWGLGWAGSIGAAGCLGLAFAIFAVQIVIAHVWLRYFRFGPLEWVWRALVYLRRP